MAAARPLTGAADDYDPLLELIGDARFVLLGEASHGTHEFYRERAQITKRLIREKGFNAVAVEADWPDAYRVNRSCRGQLERTAEWEAERGPARHSLRASEGSGHAWRTSRSGFEGGNIMAPGMEPSVSERPVAIPVGERRLIGTLALPRGTGASILFAHGSGSGRFSPRNQFVAQALQDAGLGTLLIDLLEEDEAEDRRKVFDIELLADRLQAAARWLGRDAETRGLRLGYFGASTGAAAPWLRRPAARTGRGDRLPGRPARPGA